MADDPPPPEDAPRGKSYHYDPAYYLKRRFSDPYDRERGVQPFCLQTLHSFYSQYSKHWNSTTARLLEYGGGPTVYSLISAARVISEITFVDHLQSSLDHVLDWTHGTPGTHDWKPYIKYVVCELEGLPDDSETNQLVQDREKELREKLKHFNIGDLRAENGVVLNCPHKEFDVVSSHLCLETAAKTKEQYRSFLRKLAALVKPGGFLVCTISLEETYWVTNQEDTRIPHLYLTVNDAEKAFGDLGFNIVQVARHDVAVQAQHILNDCKVQYFIAAQKPGH